MAVLHGSISVNLMNWGWYQIQRKYNCIFDEVMNQ